MHGFDSSRPKSISEIVFRIQQIEVAELNKNLEHSRKFDNDRKNYYDRSE